MAETLRSCEICATRRPRRFCPSVGAQICPVCCGTGREVSLACPLDCPYLVEARKRDRPRQISPDEIPNRDIHVDEAFLDRNQTLFVLLAASIAYTGVLDPNIYDADIREALAGLVRSYRTRHSGLIYDSRPGNPLAARIYTGLQETVDNLRQRAGGNGVPVRDADVLGVLAFLERLELQHNNGRPKGRAFLHLLTQFLPPQRPEEGSLIQTP